MKKSSFLVGTMVLHTSLLTLGCGSSLSTESTPSEALNPANNPDGISFFEEPVERRFDLLPRRSVASAGWYHGDYYPFSADGIARRDDENSLSPAEKYDAAFHQGRSLAASWERKHHGHARNPESWEGHCNGVAAAITFAPEAKHTVTVNNVTFTPEDIKALLAEIFFASPTIMVGQRCEESLPSGDGQHRPTQSPCRDINPGAFHLALSHMLGRKNAMVVADITQGEQVWNYPVREFHVVDTQDVSLQEARDLVDAPENLTLFSPQTVRYIKVRGEMIYLSHGNRTLSYDYILEISPKGEIIGGEWLGSSKTSHPDFLWRPQTPGSGNPHIQVETVKNLLFQSL